MNRLLYLSYVRICRILHYCKVSIHIHLKKEKKKETQYLQKMICHGKVDE